MGWRAWTNDEDKYIAEHPDMFPEDIARVLNRTKNAVRNRLQVLCIKQGRRKAGWKWQKMDVADEVTITYDVDGVVHTAKLRSCIVNGVIPYSRRVVQLDMIKSINVKRINYGKKEKENRTND